jgi:hypothetical protein
MHLAGIGSNRAHPSLPNFGTGISQHRSESHFAPKQPLQLTAYSEELTAIASLGMNVANGVRN